MRHKTLGNIGFLVATALGVAMSAMNFFGDGGNPIPGSQGICLPSPNLWVITPVLSWILVLCLIIGLALVLVAIDKSYSLIRGTDMVLPAAFVIMAASNPWLSGLLNTSIIMAMVNAIALYVMFGCYRAHNATQQMFVVATTISLCSMFQYAFIVLIPVYLVIAFMMKCLRLKEFMAYLMGLAAPYWVAVGMGIVDISDFNLPRLQSFIDGLASKSDLLVTLITIGFTALTTLILALNNAVKLYAGNSQRRICNNAFMVLGIFMIAAMLVDFSNLPAYVATLYLVSAIEWANLFSLWNIPYSNRWVTLIAAIYIASFVIPYYNLL